MQLNKVCLTLLNGTGFIFNTEDYVMLRQKYRIVGTRRGACFTQKVPASRFTLPVQLSPLETCLLVEQGIAVLMSKKTNLMQKLSTSEQDTFTKHLMQNRIQNQVKITCEELLISRKRLGKRKHSSTETIIPPNFEDINNKINQNLKNLENNVNCKTSSFETVVGFPLAHVAEIASIQIRNSFKYRVFKDLWLRGYYITCGDVYGGDFIIYTGDPDRYHSSHIINLVPDGKLNVLKMITMSRMATNVGKMCVFAYLTENDENETSVLKYHTISWNKELNDTVEDDESGLKQKLQENESSTESNCSQFQEHQGLYANSGILQQPQTHKLEQTLEVSENESTTSS